MQDFRDERDDYRDELRRALTAVTTAAEPGTSVEDLALLVGIVAGLGLRISQLEARLK
jgi:hypothetical protein